MISKINRRTMFLTLSLCLFTICTAENSFYFNVLQNSFSELRKLKNESPKSLVVERQLAGEISRDLSTLLKVEQTKSFVKSLKAETLQAEEDDVANCTADILRIFAAVGNNELWAIQMIDAFGKMEPDILGGSQNWLGAYDECKGAEPVSYIENGTVPYTPFNTQYCKVLIGPNPPISLFDGKTPFYVNSGFCLPDTCSESEALAVLNMLFALQQPIQNITFWAGKVTCTKDPEIDDVAITAMVVLGFLTFLSLLGTAVDISFILFPSEDSAYLKHSEKDDHKDPHFNEKTPLIGEERVKQKSPEPGTLRKLLLSFSLYSNAKKLLSTAQGSDTLTALNGIRFLSISWVVLGHSYIFGLGSFKNSQMVYTKFAPRWTFQAIANALVSVDSFFALSGLLLAYLTLKELERKGGVKNFNWIMFYFHRFWRLTPVYMLIILADVGLFRYVTDGPEWPEKGVEPDQCKESWWWNLLYINNFEVKEGVGGCFGHSWYLANDMQFFILSPLMLIPLHYNGIIGLCVCMAFILGTWIASGVISTHYDLPPSFFMSANGGGDYFKYYYVKPWCRMGPYIVGIMAGYLLYKFKVRFRINKILNLFIWAVIATLALVILYGLHDFFNGEQLETEVTSLYNTTHRTLWGVCVCWVIFACATGHGGFVNTLLSWSAFTPLARLSYCVYLVHPFIMYANYYSRRQLIYLTDHEGIYLFLGHLVLSNMVAFVASLLFEAPMLGLEKVLLKRGHDKK